MTIEPVDPESYPELSRASFLAIAEGMNGTIGTIGLQPAVRRVGAVGEYQEEIKAGDPGAMDNPIKLDNALDHARRTKTHLWIMTMAHAISDQSLATMHETPPIFDRETLMYSGLGCYVCEREYQHRLRFRPCTGEPQ